MWKVSNVLQMDKRQTAHGSWKIHSRVYGRKGRWLARYCFPSDGVGDLLPPTPLTTPYATHMGTAVAQWLRCCVTIRKVAGSIPAGVSGIFHWHKILLISLSLGVKAALSPSCAVVTKSGNLNFLEPSGHVQACNGTALRHSNKKIKQSRYIPGVAQRVPAS